MSDSAGKSGGDSASWATFVNSAPGLAAAVRGRFDSNLHHLVATIRSTGAPRLSGTEVRFDDVRSLLWIGMMPYSRKLDDVRRDPRVELHSAPLEDDLQSGDAKLAGRLVELDGPASVAEAGCFELHLALASLVRVDHDELVVTTWRPGRGTRDYRRD